MLLSACGNATVESLNTFLNTDKNYVKDFAGVRSLNRTADGSYVLYWDHPKKISDINQVKYSIYLSKSAPLPTEAGSEVPGASGNDEGIQLKAKYLVLNDDESPLAKGSLIGSVSGARSYKIDVPLQDNAIYAFQVVASMADGNRESNKRVLVYDPGAHRLDFAGISGLKLQDDGSLELEWQAPIGAGIELENIKYSIYLLASGQSAKAVIASGTVVENAKSSTGQILDVPKALLPSQSQAALAVLTGARAYKMTQILPKDATYLFEVRALAPTGEQDSNQRIAVYRGPSSDELAKTLYPECTADGEIGCITTESVRGAVTYGLAAKVLSGKTVAGIAGNLTLPAASNVRTGSGAYGEPGSQLTPSYSPDFPSLANVRAIDTVDGANGTLADCNAANSTGCVTTSSYISMDLSAASATTDLTSSNFNASIATAANFEFWDSTGARHQVAGDSDLSADKLKSGVALFGVTGAYPSATYPLASNTAATDLTLFTTQLTSDGSFEFFDSAGAKYTGSGDSDLVAANVKNTVAFENLSITGNYVATLVCPTGWIKVPGDSAYGTNDFCVMKYEAKNVSSVATSQAASTPWVSITQTAAITACRALGTGYDLISNAQWMTIGANVAARASNWSGGAIGTGYLFSGHNDASPATACAASSNESLFYVETDCTPLSSGDSTEQRRTLTLSNGEVIWDFSGNVWEWVNSINRGDKPGATAAFYEYTAVTGTTTTALKDLVPTNAVKSFWSDSWNSGQWVGQFYPGINGSGGALLRGGNLNDGLGAGVFAANLNLDPLNSDANIGLRCVLTGLVP